MVGPNASVVADRVFRGRHGARLASAASNTLHYGHVVRPDSGGEVVDEAIVRVVGADESWLGEPVVEVNCHGGVAAVQATLDAVAAAGATRANWQGLATRAFERRHIDAVQLEAWRRLPGAKTALAADMLLAQWRGALSHAALEKGAELLL